MRDLEGARTDNRVLLPTGQRPVPDSHFLEDTLLHTLILKLKVVTFEKQIYQDL
jgi:hypothetical protein